MTTTQEEFYAIAFRKNIYPLKEMQAYVDQWISIYNTQRPHSGRYCFGKITIKPL